MAVSSVGKFFIFKKASGEAIVFVPLKGDIKVVYGEELYIFNKKDKEGAFRLAREI